MKTAFLIIFTTLGAFIFIVVANHYRNKARVVFCNVDQGDGIYFRLESKTDVLIDSGPYSKILNCLNEEMPYFDRQIEMLFLTHPEADHYGGLFFILNNFRIKALYLPEYLQHVRPTDQRWKQLWRTLNQRINQIVYLNRGDRLIIGQDSFTVLWPEITDPNSPILTQEPDFNNHALGLLAQIKDKQILLLSDLDILPAERAIEQLELNVEIFKINHHGSKYSTSQKLLELANPQLAVISVGQDNWFGHPHPETLRLLQNLNIPFQRTDKIGKIVLSL